MAKKLKEILDEAASKKPLDQVVHEYWAKHHVPGNHQDPYPDPARVRRGPDQWHSELDGGGNHYSLAAVTHDDSHHIGLENHIRKHGFKISNIKHYDGAVGDEGEIPGKTKRYHATRDGVTHLVHHAMSTKPNEVSPDHHWHEVQHTDQPESMESVADMRQNLSFKEFLHQPENKHHLDNLKQALTDIDKKKKLN